MNARVSPIIGRRGSAPLWLGVLLAISLVPVCVRAADPLWINTGTITSAPQVDATNFVNLGTINISTSLPFETSNTRNFTNSGTMTGGPGWFLDNGPAGNGQRSMAGSVVNLNPGVIQSRDSGTLFFVGPTGGGSVSVASYLWVTSTNIVNQGTMSVGGNGWLRLIGTNVNVSRSALEVTGLTPQGSFNNYPSTNFFPDVAITDVYWGPPPTNMPVLTSFNSVNVWDGTTATAPSSLVQFGPGGPWIGRGFTEIPIITDSLSNATDFVGLTLTNMDGSTTNLMVPTNMVKQAVFISLSDPALSGAVKYFPSSDPRNPYQTICVKLSLSSIDVISGNPSFTSLYFYDTLAAETNRGALANASSTVLPPNVPYRPANYLLSRIDDGRFAAGGPGGGPPDQNFYFDPSTYSPTSKVVTAEYGAYEGFVDNLASEPPPLAAGAVTNFPGRVQVYADQLDFRSTRVRGEGEFIIHANHLLSTSDAAVDCQNLSYTLGSTNGNLNVANLAKSSVTRLKGDLFAWSGLWTNTMTFIFPNYSVTNTFDTNGIKIGTNAILVPVTNTATVGLHALVLSGSSLIVHLPVITWDMVTHSTNVVLNDSLAVVQNLFIDGQSLTVNGNLTLTNTTIQSTIGQTFNFALNNWIWTNAPNLLYLTNNGSLIVPDEAHFGDDRPVPYSGFVNAGTVTSSSLNVNSSYIENDGALSARVGPISLAGNAGIFQNGQAISGGDIDLTFGGLKFNKSQLSAAGALNLNVTNGLSDAGAGSGNLLRVRNGFSLPVKPVHGDLIGTTLQSQPADFIEVTHSWAGQDFGAMAAGYSDNVALGKLILTSPTANSYQFPLFFFTGTGATNGLYVDLLDLTSMGSNYLNLIQIDPSLTIYYAAAKISFTPPPNAAGIPQEPEEFLNGQFGGHLKWVSTFAGPNSSVDVVINGVTVAVNSALRFSKIIDSNGNGIPNFYDPYPFSANPLVLTATLTQNNQPPPGSVAVSWVAAPKKTYQIEFTDDMRHSNWQPLTQYSSSAATNSTVTIWDTNAPAGTQRFYRVKTTP
jgi:hypothetical protein